MGGQMGGQKLIQKCTIRPPERPKITLKMALFAGFDPPKCILYSK